MDTPPTLTHHARIYGPNGRPRHVAVTLPYVSSIADLPSYQQPPPAEPRERGAPFAPRIGASKASRKRLSRARDKIGFECATQQIMRRGA